MGVILTKGGILALSRAESMAKRILIGIGWETCASDKGPLDLAASIFMLKQNGTVRNDGDFITSDRLVSPDGSVQHAGRDLTAQAEGDKERITVNLELVPQEITKLVVCVTICDQDIDDGNFSMVSEAFLRISDQAAGRDMARFSLSEFANTETAMIFGEIYRDADAWKFQAAGQGLSGGLAALIKRFGVHAA